MSFVTCEIVAMANELTRGEKADLYDDVVERGRRLQKRIREEGQEYVKIAETNLAAAAAGFARGWMGAEKFQILGNDADGVLGIALHGVALYQGGNTGQHLHAVANGGTAPWLARMGERWAQDYKAKHPPTKSSTEGEDDPPHRPALPPPAPLAIASPRIDPQARIDLLRQIANSFQR